jgi:prolyl 4-hydroxylase
MFIRIASQTLFLILAAVATTTHGADYGLDCSFPIHSFDLSCGDLLGDRKQFYEDFMAGCREFYGKKGNRCDQTEVDRLTMSKRQPKSMVRCKMA